MEWQQLPEIHNDDSTIVGILRALHDNKNEFFARSGGENGQTQLMKQILRDLGHSKGYKAYANKQKIDSSEDVSFVNKEWLYDLHWYTDEDYFFPISLPLVAEFEWDNLIDKRAFKSSPYYREEGKEIRYGAVMYDFQKLLVSNAELRLMVFKLLREADLVSMKLYFETAISKYRHLQKRDKFLIVGYYENAKQIFHITLQK